MASILRVASRRRPPISLLRRPSPAAKRSFSGEQDLIFFDPKKLPTDYNPSNFDPSNHRSPPSDRVFRLVDEISSLTLSEITILSSILMQKAAFTDPPAIGIIKPGAFLSADAGSREEIDAREEEVVEKMVFDVKIESFEAACKIKVIKEVRAATELGLKEAKELVERSPAVVRSGVSREEGERIVEKMTAAGAKVVLV